MITHRGARLATLALGLILTTATQAAATDYFVSPKGKDKNKGTSDKQPWQTVARVNQATLKAGDRVFFLGGSTFSGNLYFTKQNAMGTAANPVTIGSYGTGQATINAGKGTGLMAYNTGGMVVENLRFTGSGISTNTGSGVVFYNDLSGNTLLQGVRVQNVYASGFRDYGIVIGSWNGGSGYAGVQIRNCTTTANGRCGISTYAAQPNVHTDVYVGYCESYQNPGIATEAVNTGSGIVLGGVKGGTVERSVAHHNGASCKTSAGPVGIWAYDSTRVVIQHNESYANTTAGTGDGDGFDLDQNCTDSILQYNYSHDNAGAGYLLCQGTSTGLHSGNVVRYNISQNDARKQSSYGAISIYGRVKNAEIYNNVIYVAPSSLSGSAPRGILVANWGATSLDVSSVHFRNNIVYSRGGVPLIEVTSGQTSGAVDLLFQRNNYYTAGDPLKIIWGSKTYSSVGSWQSAAPAQEKVNGVSVALTVDPALTNPGGAGVIGDASRLEEALGCYRLLSTSPLIDAGLELCAPPFSLPTGGRDFYGGYCVQGLSSDVGAHEAARA